MAQALMAYGRTYVAPPVIRPTGHGLLFAAEVRDVSDGDPALRGFAFDSDAAEMTVGITSFVTGGNADHTNNLVDDTDDLDFVSDDPFTVYGSFAGTMPIRSTEEAEARATARLKQVEGFGAEQNFWAGTLAKHAAGSLLNGGTAVSAKLGLGLLLEWAGQNYAGIPMVHTGLRGVNELASQQLVDIAGEGVPTVKGGSILVPGAGYFSKPTINTAADGSGTAVTPGANEVWLFASGSPLIYRGEVTPTVAPKWSINRVRAYAQRTYTAGVDGLVAAVRITLT